MVLLLGFTCGCEGLCQEIVPVLTAAAALTILNLTEYYYPTIYQHWGCALSAQMASISMFCLFLTSLTGASKVLIYCVEHQI